LRHLYLIARYTFLMLCMSSMCPTADAGLPTLEEALRQLTVPDDALLKRLNGLSWRASLTLTSPGSGSPITRELVYNQLSENMWNLEVDGEQTFSIQRDRDFWFTTIVGSLGDRNYDRLGFDRTAADSIEGSRFAQDLLLSASTHVLEMSLSEFIQRPGMTFKDLSFSTAQPEELRVNWLFEPEAGVKSIPAHGTLQWKLDDSVPLITRYDYWFGSPEKQNPKGVTCETEFDLWNGRLIPVQATRTDNSVVTVVDRVEILSAVMDESFYRPEQWGLKRPARPIEKWKLWAVAALGLGSVWFFGFRRRTHPGFINKILRRA